jgi:hypothetical protein
MAKKNALKGFDSRAIKVCLEQADCDLCAEKKGRGFQDCASFYLERGGEDAEPLVFLCGECLSEIAAQMERKEATR